jgi:hypothetical protein
VKCTQRLAPAIEAAGGQPMMYKTGHSLIKAKMKEVDSPLGGEMSGHIFFKERWYGFDDGTYAGCRLLEIRVAARPERRAERAADQLLDAGTERAMRGRRAAPRRRRTGQEGEASPPAKVSTIDGLRVDWPDGFGLMRGVQHHAGAGAALRGPHAGGDAPHRGRDAGAAAQREAGREDRRGGAFSRHGGPRFIPAFARG